MEKAALKKEVFSTPQIPDKLYFKIGEVAKIIGVKPYVLRYWETEFTEITPTKSKKGQRLYKKRDVETILKIRDLLYKEKFTIDGARKKLLEKPKKDKAGETEGQISLGLPMAESTQHLLKKIRDGLADILKEVAS